MRHHVTLVIFCLLHATYLALALLAPATATPLGAAYVILVLGVFTVLRRNARG